MRRQDIRNIAIIAHVDHGKTTLVDCLLKQSGQFRDAELAQDCILDSNDQERERGITILAKNIAVMWKGVKINIIDTPGHADFGGEVERVLQMADGALVMVDAFEGPRPQTRYVLKKALEAGLQPLVVVNKIDRPDCRPHAVVDETFDLFVELGANDETLDFPYIFASAREGFATSDPDVTTDNITQLLDLILEKIPGPLVKPEDPVQMVVTTLEYSNYLGRIAVGRLASGRLHPGDRVALMRADGTTANCKLDNLQVFDKLGRTDAPEATAGDLVALIGLPDPDIGDTIACVDNPVALPRIEVDNPTLSMTFTINDGPLSGRDGKFVTTRHIRDRLMRELESNVALRVEETDDKDKFKVSGRGILHLSVLIESMRREGYELCVGKPEVIRKQVDGKWHEPYELLEVDVPAELVGAVMEPACARKGVVLEMTAADSGMTHLEFSIPARGLIGLRTRLLNATKGEAIIHHRFDSYKRVEGEVPKRPNGVLVSQEDGRVVGFALFKLQERSELFVAPGDDVYEGMIVGENARDNDMVVNPIKAKKQTNIRTSNTDENIVLKPPRDMSLEAALEYIEGDEYVEITPKVIRLRKILLRETDRKRVRRSS